MGKWETRKGGAVKVAHILIADTPEGSVALERILQGHECTVVHEMNEAERHLKRETFDLIVAALHFDDSQMFELIRAIKRSPKSADKPIICFCSRDTQMSRLMHESLEHSTKALGAWMYLAEHSYNVYQNPDAELRRVMDRCLTEGSRKDIQRQRLDIQKQREDLQQLRTLLEAQEWSPEMKDYLAGLKHDMELLLKEVARLHSAADAQGASVVASRDLKDRVAEHVTMHENGMTSTEEIQSAKETSQSVKEEQLGVREDLKEAEGPAQAAREDYARKGVERGRLYGCDDRCDKWVDRPQPRFLLLICAPGATSGLPLLRIAAKTVVCPTLHVVCCPPSIPKAVTFLDKCQEIFLDKCQVFIFELNVRSATVYSVTNSRVGKWSRYEHQTCAPPL